MSTKSKYALKYTIKNRLTPGSENRVLDDSSPIEAYNRLEAAKKACKKLNGLEMPLDTPADSGLKKIVGEGNAQLQVPAEWPLGKPEEREEMNLKP
jgi:hypothetical protein